MRQRLGGALGEVAVLLPESEHLGSVRPVQGEQRVARRGQLGACRGVGAGRVLQPTPVRQIVHPPLPLTRPEVPGGQGVPVLEIARQRPGTASGFVFLSLEDETGVANAIVTPDLFDKNRLPLVREQFLMIEGKLQNLDNVISVKAERILPLAITHAPTESHDFH